MVNYDNGKIYKIERISDNVLIYVGSTTKEYLSFILLEHKNKATKYPNRKVYKLISDNEGWENHQILLIKNYPCGSRDELRSEESRFIKCLKPYGNKQIPMRTKQEYYLDNCETIQLRFKQYYLDNCEKIKLRYIKFRKENPETVKQWKQKERLKHIEKYKAQAKKIVNCCCGNTYTYGHKTRHLQTKLHINSIPVQFKLIEEMHKNRKQYIPPLLTF